LIGFSKAFSAGWIYGLQDQIDKFGKKVVYTLILSTFGSLLLAALCWFILGATLTGFVVLFLFYGFGVLYCYEQIKKLQADLPKQEHTTRVALLDLFMGNVNELTSELEKSVGPIPKAWPFLVKHFIPQVLLLLFINLACAKTDGGNPIFGHYADYAVWPFQAVGIFVVLLVSCVFTIGLGRPDAYQLIASEDEREFRKHEEEILRDSYIEMSYERRSPVSA